MKAVWIILVFLALGAGAIKLFTGSSARACEDAIALEATAVVRRGPLPITVTESGYLKAKNSIELQPQFAGQGLITWLVKEGDAVEKDNVLVEFDKTELEQKIAELHNDLIHLGIALAKAQTELETQGRDGQASVERAEFNLEKARHKLALYEKGEAPNELRKKKLEVEKANSELERARRNYENVPKLREKGFLTKNQAEEEFIKLRQSEINAETAAKELELFETYTYPMERDDRANAVKDAQRELTNARANYAMSRKEKEANLAGAEGAVKTKESRLAILEKELGFMTMRAPQAGIVHYGDPDYPWSVENVKVGNRFSQGDTVVTLPDLREMQVRIKVHEGDIDLVLVGQEVRVTLEAVKNRVFDAKVTRVATVATADWQNPTSKTFEIEITMPPVDVALRANVTAKAEIQVETVPDALQVPIHAVLAEGTEHFAFVPDGHGYAKRTVEIGKSNNHFVQLLKGLSENERVLLYDPRDSGLAEETQPAAPAAAPAAMPAATPTPTGSPSQ